MSIAIKFTDDLSLLLDLSLSTVDKRHQLLSADMHDSLITWNFDCATITDKIIIDDKFLRIKRNTKILKSNEYSFSFKITTPLNQPEIFAPGIIFKENKEGTGCFPRIKKDKAYSFDESRTNIPGCIVLFNTRSTFITSTRASFKHQSVAFLKNEITYRMPAEEWPTSYNGRNIAYFTSDKRDSRFKTLAEDTEFENEYLIYLDNDERESKNLYDELFEKYKSFASYFRGICEPTESTYISWWDYKALLLIHLLNILNRDDKGTFIWMGKDNGSKQQYYNYTSASFLVKSIEAACIFTKLDIKLIKSNISKPILQLLEETEDRIIPNHDYKKLGEEIGDFFLKGETSKGIYKDNYDIYNDTWESYASNNSLKVLRNSVNTRTNGEAMLAYTKLYSSIVYDLKPEYMMLIKRVASFFIDHQMDNGNYGKWLNEQGEVIDSRGCNGAHMLRFMIELYKKTNSIKYYESILKAVEYYERIIINNEYYGDTLDTNCCDKESGAILLNTFLSLYEMKDFHTERYLNLCKKAANFVVTWIVLDDIKFKSRTPLGKMDFKTTGFTSVSISNESLDFYGMKIAYDFLRLNKICGDEFYKEMAILMIKACRELISSPQNDLGRTDEFYGWLPGKINHTRWDYFNDQTRISGYFEIDIAWQQIVVLDYLDKIQRDFYSIFKEI
jgi:hypothetical protein